MSEHRRFEVDFDLGEGPLFFEDIRRQKLRRRALLCVASITGIVLAGSFLSRVLAVT